ncbi:3-hydroxyacyl-CoA dehydrogenase [Prosthecomicrobium hirschii]|uniref:SDR family NAD(P)-dependent oxidoreductase n=1 Tax=Prosthecodimorpha hirschii TaxID=665126 RepID=UPI00112D52B1|nr:SDR family NAD(P)-dependent oxidoreductase [Prosthecomicrobium hirschii]TPQ47707.1 3-hydroxyacyl-CoA dehydrogenase [Prosthecomicrobium hirschii]
MAGLLQDKVALVTGGAQGIGLAVARAFLAEGAAVAIADVRADVLEAAAAGLPGRVLPVTLDVTDEAAIAAAAEQAEAAHGPVDILVANAGAAASGPFDKTERATWDAMLAVNLTGVWLTTRAFLPGMVKRRSGRVIAIASTAGLVGYPYVAAYVAAKHGVVGLVRALALEVARKGVTVNAVCPGFTETDLVAQSVATIVAKTGRSADEARAELAKSNPMGRLVTPEEVADAILWLAGQGAASINGQAIAVAGGEVMTG